MEAARARVRCAWAKFKELSPILTVRGASYRIKGRIYSACVQSVLIYGTETWAMKADDLRSLERTERMMVRWMCGVSLKDRRRSEDLCNLLGINCVADVVRRGRLRWFGHLEHKSVDDWVSACRGLVVEGARGRGRSRKTWEQCVRDDMNLLGLHSEWAIFKDMWRGLDAVHLRIKSCVESICKWCSTHQLQLNSNRTELIWFCTRLIISKLQALRWVSRSVVWRSNRSNQCETMVSRWIVS